jgi:uncharacterized membrane protein YkvA (DUF1232 family)
MQSFWDHIRQRAKQFRIDVFALYFAYQDPRLPMLARLFAACVVAYAFSPIDLIPDPIPVLGYLDDLVIIPLGVWLALKMIPAEVMAEARLKAGESVQQKNPVNWVAGAIILLIWLALAAIIIRFTWQFIAR